MPANNCAPRDIEDFDHLRSLHLVFLVQQLRSLLSAHNEHTQDDHEQNSCDYSNYGYAIHISLRLGFTKFGFYYLVLLPELNGKDP